MHPRVIWAIIRKDALDIWLNKSTLFGLIYPIVMSLVFLLISHLVGRSSNNLLIYNPGNSNLAQVVAEAFQNPEVTRASSAAEVEAAFGPNGTQNKSSYALGLILPTNFDSGLRAGTRPTLGLFLNGSSVNAQTEALLQSAIINHARATANPQPPVRITTTVINPPSSTSTGALLAQVYSPLVLLLSLIVGTTFIPLLLLEEKEKKTLRMLLVTPASFNDILIGKLLIVLVFQLAITSVALAIQGGFSGNLLLVVFYVLIGAFFSLSLGLFFGSVFNTASAAGTVAGIVAIVYIIGGLFVGQLGQIVGNGLVLQIARLLPTYYLAEGVANASQNLGSLSSNLLDTGVILVSTLVLFVISAWELRRQSAVLAVI
jgi:ABC-2 type transport system permease protein